MNIKINLDLKSIVEIFKKICEFIDKKKIITYSSYEKYLINSCKRKDFNDVFLDCVEIKYTFKDNPNDEKVFSFDAEYIFDGYVNDIGLSHLLIYLNMKEYNKDNIKIKAYDIYTRDNETKNCVTPEISRYGNHGKPYGDNGAYWEIPFFGTPRRHMGRIKTKLKISWNSFSPKNDTATLIIDPRNYASVGSIKELKLTVINKATNCNINTIKMCEYNRKTRKLFNNNSEYEIYNSGNNPNNDEGLVYETIPKEVMNENKVFILKCQSNYNPQKEDFSKDKTEALSNK